jgi:hypothetical protein
MYDTRHIVDVFVLMTV